MIKLNCLCKDWKTHRCRKKIVIYHDSPRADGEYEVWFHGCDGEEALIETGKDSLLKFAKEIIKLVAGKDLKVIIGKTI